MNLDRKRPAGYRKAWNGGSREAAMAGAKRHTEACIVAGCPRCTLCNGDGVFHDPPRICDGCGAAGYLIPPGGMPRVPSYKPRIGRSVRKCGLAAEAKAP